MNLFDSYIEGAQELPYNQRAAFILAVVEYVSYKREPPSSLKGVALGMFKMLRPSLDKQIARSEAGREGGKTSSKTRSKRPSKTQANGQADSEANGQPIFDTNIYRVTTTREYQGEEESLVPSSESNSLVTSGFRPPTVDEVRDFCAANMLDKCDPELFCATYEAQGWRVGNGLPMSSWQAMVQKWHMQDRNKEAAERAKRRKANYSEFSEDNWQRG